MFETPLVPRSSPVVGDDVPWEQYRELDPVGAAQAEAEWWAMRQSLDPVTWEPLPDGPDARHDARRDASPEAGPSSADRGREVEECLPPAGTAAIAAGVADR